MPGLSCVACLGAVRSRLTVSTADAIHDKRLVRVLIDEEPPAVLVSLIYPGQGRLPMKTVAFMTARRTRYVIDCQSSARMKAARNECHPAYAHCCHSGCLLT
jgi:hypothetical protein